MPGEAPAEDTAPGPPDGQTDGQTDGQRDSQTDGQGDGQADGPRPARSAGLRGNRSRPRTEHSAGGVVLRRIGGTLHVLLIRDPYQNWGLPKGHVEEGEDAREAALREVREETGLSQLELGPDLGTIDWFFRADAHLVHKFCTFFAMGSADGTAVPETDEGITECMWVPASEAPDHITYDNAREVVIEALRRLEEDELPV